MNIKSLLASAATISALLGTDEASAASVASVVQTKSNVIHFTAFDNTDQNIILAAAPGLVENFKPFDTTLGTLVSINVAWMVNLAASVVGGASTSYISSNEGTSYHISSTDNYARGSFDLYGEPPLGSIFKINGGASNSKLFTLSKPDDPGIKNVLAGNGPFSAVFNAGDIVLHAYQIVSGSVDLSHTTVVTYTYTPAVPEPETYAMLFAGLSAIKFVAGRRKSI